MQTAIDMAMSNNDPAAKAYRAKLFGNTKSLSPEDFIKIISEVINDEHDNIHY